MSDTTTGSGAFPLTAMMSMVHWGVSPSSFLGPMLSAAKESLAEDFDPQKTNMLIDAVSVSSQARVLSDAFWGSAQQSPSSSMWSPMFGAAGYSVLGSTLAFLAPSGLFSMRDMNDDHRLSVGELLDIAA